MKLRGRDGDHRQRLRFARREIDRLAKAVEQADGDEIEAGMRLIAAEETIADLRDTVERQRIVIGDLQAIVEGINGGPDGLKRVDEIMRVWVARAS